MRTPTQLRAAAMPLRAQRADDRAQPQEEEIVVIEPLSRRSLAAFATAAALAGWSSDSHALTKMDKLEMGRKRGTKTGQSSVRGAPEKGGLRGSDSSTIDKSKMTGN